MKNVKKYLPWAVAAVAVVFLIKALTEKPEPEYIYREVKVEVPVVEHHFDTILKPVPVVKTKVEIDSTLYEEYKKLKDSVAKDSAYREAIKINEYQEVFEDSIQTIDVYTKTRGVILEQAASYKTKPRTVTAIDSIKIEPKIHFNVGVEAGVPTIPTLATSPVAKVNLMLVTKKQNSYSVSYDTEGRIWVGKTWKISLRGKNKKN